MSTRINPSPLRFEALTQSQPTQISAETLSQLAQVLDGSSRAGTRVAFGKDSPASTLSGLAAKSGISKQFLDLLGNIGGFGAGPLGGAGDVARGVAMRQRLLGDLPFIADHLVKLSRADDPAAAGLAGALVDPLARSYDLWASQFNPLMSPATALGFAKALSGGQLSDNALLQDLSRQLGGTFSDVVGDIENHALSMQALETSGLRQLFEPQSLASALTRQLGGFPQDFSPFQTLSQSVRSEIASLGSAVPQSIDALRAQASGFSGEVRSLENRANRALSDLDQMARDPVSAFKGILPGETEIAGGQVGASATAFQAAGAVGDPNGLYHAQGSITVGQVSASAGGRITTDLSNLTLAGEAWAEASATAIDAQGSFHVGNGFANVGGSGEIYVGATAAAHGSFHVSPDRIVVEAAGEAYAGARAQGEVHATLGPLSGSAKGEAAAIAMAKGEVGAAYDIANGDLGVHAAGEAFVGARVQGELRGSAGPLSGGIGGGAMVGVGVNAGIKAGFRDGKLALGLDLGLALGIGLRLKLDIAIDFKAIGKAISDGVNWLKDNIPGAKAVIEGVGKAVKWVGKAASDVVKGVGKAAKAVGKAVKDVGKGIAKAAKSVGKAVKKFFKGW